MIAAERRARVAHLALGRDEERVVGLVRTGSSSAGRPRRSAPGRAPASDEAPVVRHPVARARRARPRQRVRRARTRPAAAPPTRACRSARRTRPAALLLARGQRGQLVPQPAVRRRTGACRACSRRCSSSKSGAPSVRLAAKAQSTHQPVVRGLQPRDVRPPALERRRDLVDAPAGQMKFGFWLGEPDREARRLRRRRRRASASARRRPAATEAVGGAVGAATTGSSFSAHGPHPAERRRGRTAHGTGSETPHLHAQRLRHPDDVPRRRRLLPPPPRGRKSRSRRPR